MILFTNFSALSIKPSAWNYILELVNDDDIDIRWIASNAAGSAYSHISDRTKAWYDLHNLVQDRDCIVRCGAAKSLGDAFLEIPSKNLAWQDLHILSQDQDSFVRWGTVEAIRNIFSQIPNKNQAWQDLHILSQDQDSFVRWGTVEAIRNVFSQIPNKNQAWQDLHILSHDQDSFVRSNVAQFIGNFYYMITDRVIAWQDLHKLSHDKDQNVRLRAVEALGVTYSDLPDKIQAWQDLYYLIQDEDPTIRLKSADALGLSFLQIPDKDQALKELVNLTQDRFGSVRIKAIDAITIAFSQVADKNQVWQMLYNLANEDKPSTVQLGATEALGRIFHLMPDKNKAFADLHYLAGRENVFIGQGAANALGRIFGQVPNKHQAWYDLNQLSHDKNGDVRWAATEAIGRILSENPDNLDALNELDRLSVDEFAAIRQIAIQAIASAFPGIHSKHLAWKAIFMRNYDENSFVKLVAGRCIARVFYDVSDKVNAWKDIHGLINEQGINSISEGVLAEVIGNIFSGIPNRDQALSDLAILSQSLDSQVKMHAFHSLGKISILEVAESNNNEDLKRCLENALQFFEKASRQEISYNPARFCYPFYNTFFLITYQNASEFVLKEYLEKAKKAVDGSDNRNELVIALENLIGASLEPNRLSEKNPEEVVDDLNNYKLFCEKVITHLNAVENNAPMATRLIRKMLPIIDDKIKENIAKIRENSKQICKITSTKGTPYSDLGVGVNKAANSLSYIDSIAVENYCNDIVFWLKKFCIELPEGKNDLVCGAIREIDNTSEISNKLEKIKQTQIYVLAAITTLPQIIKKIDDVGSEIIERNEMLANSILEKINSNQGILGNLLRVVDGMDPEDPSLREMVEQLIDCASSIEGRKTNNKEISDKFNQANVILKNSKMDFKLKLKMSLPIIPEILELLNLPSFSCEGEAELSSDVDLQLLRRKLQAIWNGFAQRIS